MKKHTRNPLCSCENGGSITSVEEIQSVTGNKNVGLITPHESQDFWVGIMNSNCVNI